MNKFIHEPGSLAGLLGCAFWMAIFAGLMGLLFGTIYGVVR